MSARNDVRDKSTCLQHPYSWQYPYKAFLPVCWESPCAQSLPNPRSMETHRSYGAINTESTKSTDSPLVTKLAPTFPRTRSAKPDLFRNRAASPAATRPLPVGSTCAEETDIHTLNWSISINNAITRKRKSPPNNIFWQERRRQLATTGINCELLNQFWHGSRV